jgi:sodium transport system permease protein
MRKAFIVYRKELRDHLRDRRSLVTALLVPLIGPAMLMGLFSARASWTRDDRPLQIPTVGARDAPTLVQFLERYQAEIVTAPADYEAQVRDGKLDVVLVVPPDYRVDFRAGRSATVQLVVDSSRYKSLGPVNRVRRLLQEYSRQVGGMRLVARGIDPQVARPLNVEDMDLATVEKSAATLLGMMPVFVLMAVLMGGMNVAIDATAGERERGSLEPLLLNAVRVGDIVMGKWLAASSVSALSLAVSVAALRFALARMPLQDLGVRARLGPAEILGFALAALPLALAAPALQMLLAVFARSYKEAQTYLNLVMLLPMIPSFVVSLSPAFKPQPWMMLVPSLGQSLLMEGVMRGEVPRAGAFVLAAIGCLAVAASCLGAMARLLASERIVYGR